MSERFDRNPQGQFISHGEVLSAWLPALLDRSFSGEIRTMLHTAARWCQGKAAHEYRLAAEASIKEDISTTPYAIRVAARAEVWFRRRDVLAKCARELGEIR